VVYANTFKKTETTDNGHEVEAEIPFLKEYTVFNACQVEGLAEHCYELAPPTMETIQRIEQAEAFSPAPRRRSARVGTRRIAPLRRITFRCRPSSVFATPSRTRRHLPVSRRTEPGTSP
jgi:hypothetical protein